MPNLDKFGQVWISLEHKVSRFFQLNKSYKIKDSKICRPILWSILGTMLWTVSGTISGTVSGTISGTNSGANSRQYQGQFQDSFIDNFGDSFRDNIRPGLMIRPFRNKLKTISREFQEQF